MNRTKKSEEGLSLLEALIFTTILSVIMLAVVFATTMSLKRTQFNQKKIFATRYAEEVLEWMRGEKEADWTTFTSRSPQVYCMNDDVTTCSAAGSCWSVSTACPAGDYPLSETQSLNNGFSRNVTLQTDGTTIRVTAIVSWKDGSNEFDVTSSTTFSRWE